MRIQYSIVVLVALTLIAGCADKPGPVQPGGGKAIALCVGLNGVDKDHYAGWPGTLFGCESDAADMAHIAEKSGFQTTKLLTANATRDAVLKQIRDAAATLKSGGIFMITYSGHGDEIPDPQAPPDDGGMDQTWCLYDGELLDKELYAEWAKFPAGVRILVISDSCHSQGIAKMVPRDYVTDLQLRAAPHGGIESEAVHRLMDASGRFNAVTTRDRAPIRVKALPPETSIATYQKEKERYDGIVRSVDRPTAPIAPWVMSITACKNDQLAGDGASNGIFTGALKKVWDGGAFQGDYIAFHHAVAAAALEARPWQEAQRRMIDQQNQPYWSQRPFTATAP